MSPQDTVLTSLVAKIRENSGKLKICTAESCTGGMVASTLTELPGCSSFFVGAIVAYSCDLKVKLLNVRQHTLDRFGPVSTECAREMAEGALKLTGADLCVAVTGYAGPDGGLETDNFDKPTGTVCFCVSEKDSSKAKTVNEMAVRVETEKHNIVISKTHFFHGSRHDIRCQATKVALELILQGLKA